MPLFHGFDGLRRQFPQIFAGFPHRVKRGLFSHGRLECVCLGTFIDPCSVGGEVLSLHPHRAALPRIAEQTVLGHLFPVGSVSVDPVLVHIGQAVCKRCFHAGFGLPRLLFLCVPTDCSGKSAPRKDRSHGIRAESLSVAPFRQFRFRHFRTSVPSLLYKQVTVFPQSAVWRFWNADFLPVPAPPAESACG